MDARRPQLDAERAAPDSVSAVNAPRRSARLLPLIVALSVSACDIGGGFDPDASVDGSVARDGDRPALDARAEDDSDGDTIQSRHEVDVLGDGITVLDSRDIFFLVPPRPDTPSPI